MSNPYNAIDVSEWNNDIDWSKAHEDDVQFAFIRCGFGQDKESQDDKYFHINMENAIKAGVKVGVYFYSYAVNASQARGEADHCLRLIEPYKDKISFPVFYDVEEANIEPFIKETIPAFISTLNEHGYNAGVYCSVSWFDDYFSDIDCDYFWFASWGSDDGQPHNKPQWCDVWQYTSKGSVHGVGYDCVDCDIVYNTDMQLLRTESPIEKTVNIDILVDAPEDIKANVNIHRVNND